MVKSRNWHSIPEYTAFRATMQAGTTTAAGRRLGLSQSAVSRALANLEARLGVALFEREAGRLRPTQEAVRFNRRLDPLFQALERLDGIGDPVQETLRLIAPPSYAHRFMVTVISSFLKANPHQLISFEVSTSDDVVRGITEDRFDLGISGTEQSRAGVKLEPYRRSQAVAVMRPDHPLASREEILPGDLHEQDFIALTRRHARRRQMDVLLQDARAEPRVKVEVSTSFAAVDLARDGLGMTVVNPFPIYHYRARELAFVPFRSPIRYQSYFVLPDSRPVPRIARAFMRHMRLNTPPDPFTERS